MGCRLETRAESRAPVELARLLPDEIRAQHGRRRVRFRCRERRRESPLQRTSSSPGPTPGTRLSASNSLGRDRHVAKEAGSPIFSRHVVALSIGPIENVSSLILQFASLLTNPEESTDNPIKWPKL